MSMEIQRFPNEPIILVRGIPSASSANDRAQMLEEVKKFKQEMGCHVYRIIDMSLYKLDFGQVVSGMADERNQDGGMNDPDVTTLMVASDEIIRMAVASAKTAQYGSANTNLYPSVETALAQARALVANT